MSQYFDLSIRRIEIKKPKRDLKPVIKLQDEVNKTLLHDELNIIILQMKELYRNVWMVIISY